MAGSSSKTSAKNPTREQYKLHLDTLAKEGRVIPDYEHGEIWAEWVTRQCRDLGCREITHHASTADRIRKAFGSLRKDLADNPNCQRLHPSRFLTKMSEKRVSLEKYGGFVGSTRDVDPITISATAAAWMDSAELSKALGRTEQTLTGANLGYFNTRDTPSALEVQHRHVLRWVTPYPLPSPLGPHMICLEDGERTWVRRQQSRHVIGAKVPTPGVLRTLLANKDAFRKEILPAVVAHNQLMILYGEALIEVNQWARRLLSHDETDEIVTNLVDRLRALHCMLRDAREAIPAVTS